MAQVCRGSSCSATARPLEGARLRISCRISLALLLALGAAAPASAAVERQLGPPPWRLGGPAGFSLDAAAFPDSSGYHLEVYVRVPPATLRALALDETGKAQLRAAVTVRSRGGKGDPVEVVQPFSTTAGDTVQGQGRVLLFRFPVAPGKCRIDARLEDLLSSRPGLAYGKESRTQRAELRGEIEVPKPQAGRDLSDLEFIWPVAGETPGAAFVRDGRARVPNPDRLYGLYASQLETSFSARAKAGDERAWRWVLRVLDRSGAVVAQAESTAAAGRFVRGGARFDMTAQPAGTYQLDVRVWQEGDAGSLRRSAPFSMGWTSETWNRNAADVADEVHFLLQAEEEEQFAGVQPGEQERMLEEFWKQRDPTPETAMNEAYLTFRERVEHANVMYSNMGIAKGMFSDMGRVYIRYGEPFEVHKQVIPAGEHTLNRVLADIIRTEERAVGDVNQKGPGGDTRPYEVWVYEGDIPPPFDADPRASTSTGYIAKRRLLFLFVDEQGLGTYTLRYSTE
jgi:GWxTD domain-containing protein